MTLTAKDIMTAELITVTPATPLADFARICADDNISGAPVCRVDGALVGVVSKTDIIQRLLEDHGKFGDPHEGEFGLDERQVADIMQTNVLAVEPDTPIATIAARMAEERVHRVVVVDRDRVKGIVTSLDVLKQWR